MNRTSPSQCQYKQSDGFCQAELAGSRKRVVWLKRPRLSLVMEEPLDEWNGKLVVHILKHGDDLSFTKFFWKECNQRPADRASFGGSHSRLGKHTRARALKRLHKT